MPAKRKMTQEEMQTARSTLMTFLPKGSTVYTVMRSISRSKQAKNISLIQLHDTKTTPLNLSFYASRVLGFSMSQRRGDECLKVQGIGLNMAKHTVEMLGAILYDDAQAFKHVSL